MNTLIQTLATGVAVGCVYALMALGFVLIYKATEMVNFAQGELMMVGAFVAYSISMTSLGYWGALLLTPAAMFVFGYLLDAGLLRRVIGQPQFVVVILTIGLGLILRGSASMIWGADTKNLVTPFSVAQITAGSVVLPMKLAVIVIAAASLVVALYAFFSRARLGIAMQGTSENQLAAAYVGIPTKRVFSLVWGLSAAISGLAGVLVAPVILVDPNMGSVGLNAFAAAVIGGFGSLPGAAAGGIIVGITQQLASYYLPEGWREAAPYLLMLAVLVVSKEGLFGKRAQKKV